MDLTIRGKHGKALREAAREAMPTLDTHTTDIDSTTWPQIQPPLRPSHGPCNACRPLPSKKEIKFKVQLSYLRWNFQNILCGSDFIKL